jgi:hypothetical protein
MMLLTAASFAVLLILSVFVSSGFSALQASAQSSLPPPIVSGGSADLQSPILDPMIGGIINQYPDSQTYPYQDPSGVLTSSPQTLPDELLPHEEQQLLQGIV